MGLFSDVFASNVLVRWLRGDPHRYDLAVTMVGVRLGDRLLTFGASEPALVAALGRVTGLSGRAMAHARDGSEAARLQQGAERAGVLVEVVESTGAGVPIPDGYVDLVVVDAVSTPISSVLSETRRLLRPGGRLVAITRTKAAGAPSPSDVQREVAEAFRGARVLVERDGWAFIEALKGLPITPPAS